MIGSDALQIGTLTLRKLRDLEKESGMTGSKEGGSARKAEPREEVRPNQESLQAHCKHVHLSPMLDPSRQCSMKLRVCCKQGQGLTGSTRTVQGVSKKRTGAGA